MDIPKETITFPVSASAGDVTGEFTVPEKMRALYVFGHGAGAGMNHPFMRRLSELLAGHQIGTLRFNFPFAQNGKKRPDPPAVAEKACLRAINMARERFDGLPLYAGGKSFGGRMTSQALSKSGDSLVRGVVFVGFPLHAPGNPGTDRAAHLHEVSKPMLFLQGTRDALATIGLMETVCQALPRTTLVTFDGADHSFKAGKKDLLPQLASVISDWVSEISKSSG